MKVADCWKLYEEEHLPKTVNHEKARQFWGRLQWFADMDASSPMGVDQFIQERLAHVSPATINRELTHLRACLRYAERTGRIAKAPFIKTLPKSPPRMRSLSRQEAGRLIKAADNWWDQVFIKLALSTGQRPGAIIDLRWSQVDMANGAIDFRARGDMASRMKRRAVVPINDMAREALALASHNRHGNEHVIHYNGVPLSHARKIVKRLADKAKIKDVSPHVLRHTVASLLLQEGHDILPVSRLLGHANTRITEEVYFQHPPSWLKQTISSLKF